MAVLGGLHRIAVLRERVEEASGEFQHASLCVDEELSEVEHLLINHAEAVG